MGTITKLFKAGVTNSLNQFKNVDVGGKISSAVNSSGIDFKMPDVAGATKDWKLNVDTSTLKLPAGVSNYISPLASKAMEKVKLPTSISGLPIPQLPTLPDLSSVTSQVEDALGSVNFNTEKLGIRSVSDILKAPDISSLYGGGTQSPVDLNNMPDLTKALEGFNVDEIQSSIDKVTGKFPGMEKLDISKYF